jgi:hypothetical protein
MPKRPPRCSCGSSSWRRERGATSTLSELEEIAAPRPRRIHAKRGLVHKAPPRPGVYLFHAEDGRVLYVGKARDLRARLRSYFHSQRQRPAVEAALDEVARIEWRVLGSELAASLEEIALIRRLRPPANARTPRPESYVYLHRRGERVVTSAAPSPYVPLRRKDARRAAQLLRAVRSDELLDDETPALLGQRRPSAEPRARARPAPDAPARLVRAHRSRAAADRGRVRRLAVCLLVPGEAFVVQGGRVGPATPISPASPEHPRPR